MGHKCKVRDRRTRPVSSPPHPRFRGLTSCCRVCPHLNLREVWSLSGAPSAPSAPRHATVAAGAQAQAGVGGGLGHRGAGQGDAQVCQEGAAPAAEGRRGAEPGRGCALPPPVHLATATHTRPPHAVRTSVTLRTHSAGAVAAMVERLGEAHDEALGEIEEREKHFVALFGDGDDEILSSPGL